MVFYFLVALTHIGSNAVVLMLHAVLGERAVDGDIQYKLTEDDGGVNTPGTGPDNDDDNVQCVSNSSDTANDDSSLLCVWLVFDVPDVTSTHRLGQCC